MDTLTRISTIVIDADPTWTASAIHEMSPKAKVKKLLDGCTITLRTKADGGDLQPTILLTFNNDTHLVRASWAQVFPNLDRAMTVFSSLQAAAREEFLGRPDRHVVRGSKTVRSEYACRWRASGHESLTLALSQPKVREVARQVVLEHTFRQPQAALAACPDSRPL